MSKTPIEREIRKAIEREHSLRRSRGLPNPPTAPEYVEIPLRKAVSVNAASLPNGKSERYQGKDKQFAGKKMQQEIYAETRREQDLVKLGKIPGFYDKGSVQQLKERKQIFEAFQKPKDSAPNKAISNSNLQLVSISENGSSNNKATKPGSDPRNEKNLKTPKLHPESKETERQRQRETEKDAERQRRLNETPDEQQSEASSVVNDLR
uniref:Uncharacterized protein n=1 Tax=Periophthalmus magnuspinnatus TaxID=409849 RepID=A0A3B4A2X1_9GOBI